MMANKQFRSERGNPSSSIMIIGDSPSKKDLENGVCFSGDGAMFLLRELESVGIYFKDAFATTCLDYYPPRGMAQNIFLNESEAKGKGDVHFVNGQYVHAKVVANAKRVWRLIDENKPQFILGLGAVALWFLTGETSISAWRGSMLEIKREWGTVRLLPTYHPNALFRKKELIVPFRRDLIRIDLKGEWTRPQYNITIYPTAVAAISLITHLIEKADVSQTPIHISCDIETRLRIPTVIGIAWSRTDALVLPFTSVKKANYFTLDEEWEIITLLRRLLTHHNVHVSGQNYNYDDQYLARYYGFPHHCKYDTMVMAHLLWTKNQPLSLFYLSSIFCEWYRYWKDDGKDFHKSIEREEDEKTYLLYNAYDCCYTWEIVEALIPIATKGENEEPYQLQEAMHERVSRTVNRGVRFNTTKQKEMLAKINEQIRAYEAWFESLPISDCFANDKGVAWYASAAKLKKYFYEIIGIEQIKKRTAKGMRPTCDQNALTLIGKREPIFKVVCEKLCEYSSLCQFANLYLVARTDTDGRMRTNYGIAGTDTFRLNSSKDVFGTGMNLQNISKG